MQARIPRIAAALVACVLGCAACGGGQPRPAAPVDVGDPAALVLGRWEFSNQVGEMGYEFAADGTFRSWVQSRSQRFDASGSWSATSDGVIARFDDAAERRKIRFLSVDRFLEIGPGGRETVFSRAG